MTMALEYVRTRVEDFDTFAAQRDAFVAALRQRYGTDFLGAYLGRCDDGTVIDVVLWASREIADRVEQDLADDVVAQRFFSHVREVHEIRHAEVVHASS